MRTSGTDVMLLLLYVAICGAIIFRVNIETSRYLTLDSMFYLELAQNLKEGNGFYMSNQYPPPTVKTSENQVYFSLWPIGYPLLIYVISAITTLDVFWSSKILNLLFLGLGLLSLRRINRQYAYVLGSVYSAYTLLEVYTFTWSEAGFLVGTLWLVQILHQIFLEKSINRNITLLFLVCLYLFLIRYIGLFTFAFPAAGAVYFWLKNKRTVSLRFLLIFSILCLLAVIYFSINYYNTGTATGGDRLAKETEAIGQLALMFSRALLNELLIIRNYNFSGLPDILFLTTALLQLTLLFLVSWEIINTKGLLTEFRKNSFSHTCLIVAALYFVLVAALRSVSPFDALDHRILSPFTFLLLIGGVNYIVAIPENYIRFKKLKLYIFVFFVISLLLNLPKTYLLRKLTELL